MEYFNIHFLNYDRHIGSNDWEQALFQTTWQIMKTAINKNRVKHTRVKFKLSDESITSDKYIMGQPLLQSMFPKVVTPHEVHKIIDSLKNGAAGYV